MFWINVQWKGYPRIHLSTKTTRKKHAQDLVNTLKQLRAAGRRDLLGLIASHRLDLQDDVGVNDVNLGLQDVISTRLGQWQVQEMHASAAGYRAGRGRSRGGAKISRTACSTVFRSTLSGTPGVLPGCAKTR